MIQSFIVSCLACLLDPERFPLEMPTRMNWNQVYQQLVEHKLTGLFYRLGLEQPALWPEPLQCKLRRDYHSGLLWGEQCSRETRQVLKSLNQAEVPTMILKGWALIPTVYEGDFGRRTFADIDLLVPRWYAERAEKVLFDLGYNSLHEVWPGFSRRYENGRSFQLPREAGPFGAVFAIGLHWQLLDLPYFFTKIPEEALFERAASIPVVGFETKVMSPEDHLVYACGHLAFHHCYSSALFRIYEMAAMIRQAGSVMDWGAVVDRSAAWGLSIPVKNTLVRINSLWPDIIPATVLTRLLALEFARMESWLHHWSVEEKDNHAIRTALAWLTLPGIGKKIGFILETAFPHPTYMQQRYCPDHPNRWPLTYFQRAGLGMIYLISARLKKRIA
ncbi:MAG: nucleotidyltransferase family protein [Anaerolineales bacterium]|nr:nucleotidyltransferase family protein [Anaerolineales bacterium]